MPPCTMGNTLTPVYMPSLHLPGTPHRQPAILRCTGNLPWGGLTALTRVVTELNIADAGVTGACY